MHADMTLVENDRLSMLARTTSIEADLSDVMFTVCYQA